MPVVRTVTVALPAPVLAAGVPVTATLEEERDAAPAAPVTVRVQSLVPSTPSRSDPLMTILSGEVATGVPVTATLEEERGAAPAAPVTVSVQSLVPSTPPRVDPLMTICSPPAVDES